MPKKTFTAGEVLRAADVNEYLSDSRNYLINGGMDIWQRGTSSTAYGYNTADRWYFYNVAGTTTCSQSNVTSVQGARYGLTFTQSVANSLIAVQQVIETPNTVGIAGVDVTVSGYVAASASTTVSILVLYSTNVDNSVSGSWTNITATSGGSSVIPGTGVYTRMTGTYAIPSTAKTVMVRFVSSTITAGQSWSLTGVQLEEGTTATPYHRATPTVGSELAACQRYYYRFNALSTNTDFGIGSTQSTTLSRIIVTLPVQMRVATFSTLESSAVSTFAVVRPGIQGNTVTGLAISTGQVNSNNVHLLVDHGNLSVVGAPVMLEANGNSAAYLGFSAEL